MCYCGIAQTTTIQRDGYTLTAIVTKDDPRECSIECGVGPTADAPAYLEIPSVVVIDGMEYTVTSIPASGFANQKYFIGDLFFPSTLTNIGESAFYGCSGIDGHLSLPGNCYLGSTSFAGCTGVTTLTLPSGMNAHNKIFNNEKKPFPALQILYDMAQSYTGSIANMVKAFNGTTIRPEDQLASPTIEPMGGLYTNVQTVTFRSNTKGVRIYYTIDGTDPTTSSSYTADGSTLTINKPTTIKYFTYQDNKRSIIIIDEYTFKAAEPVLSTESELPFEGEIEVSIKCETVGAKIYYTTDGSDPTASSDVYNGPIKVSETTTIKAFARNENEEYSGWDDSEIVTAIYTKKGTTLAPVFTPEPGRYSYSEEGLTISINCNNEGSTTYHYTTDGSEPTKSCPVYNGPITVSNNTTIKAIACCAGLTNSAVSTATYTITKTVAKPTFYPEPGNYNETEVSINCESGVTIYYTIDGSIPSTSSNVYNRPITIEPTERTVINAIAVKNGTDPDYEWLNSELASGTYNDNTMVIFIKDGNWSNPNNWSSGFVPNKDGRAAIGANLTIANGEKAEIAYITNVPSTFYTAGTITIEDGGQLFAKEAAIENVKVKKEIAGHGGDAQNGWYAISTPMGNEINNTYYNNLITDDYDLFYYNETTWYWDNFKVNTNNFNRFRLGEAYLYANRDNNTIVSVGMPNMNPVSVSVSNTEYTPSNNPQNYDLRGFNLIGNPFTYDIGWGPGQAISSPILANGYYTLGTDGSWNSKTGNSEPIKAGTGILVQFVQDETTGTVTGTVTINATPYSQATQTRASVNESLSITVANEKYNDVAHINFGNDSEKGLRKIAHMNDDIQMVYVPVNGINYAIANVDENASEVPVSFETYVMGKYTISVKANNIHDEVYLLDKVTGEKIDILNEDYTFVTTSSGKADRFSLLFVNNDEEDSDTTNPTFAYLNNGEIIISDIEGSGDVKIYDVMGRLVIAENANGSAKISTESLTNGLYIINLIDGDGIKTQKIAIKK